MKRFIPMSEEQITSAQISKERRKKKAEEAARQSRANYVTYVTELQGKKKEFASLREMLVHYGEISKVLGTTYALQRLPPERYAAEIPVLVNMISDNSMRLDTRSQLMHVFCGIQYRSMDRFSPTFTYAKAPEFIADLKRFILEWGGMLGDGQVPPDNARWMMLLQEYCKLELVVSDSKQWPITPVCGNLLYAKRKNIVEDAAQLIDALRAINITEEESNARTGPENREAVKQTLGALERRIQQQREIDEARREQEKHKTIVAVEEDVFFEVTFSEQHMYPWFTKVFSDMVHSCRIVNAFREGRLWKRAERNEPFIRSMRVFVRLFLRDFHQKDLLNELEELKFFNHAVVPGISASSNDYEDEVNLATWRNMHLTEVTAIADVVTAENFSLLDFWDSLESGVLFSQWFQFFIARFVLQITIYRFIPSLALKIDNFFYLEHFKKSVDERPEQHQLFVHYNHWGSTKFNLFASGFDAPFVLLYGIIEAQKVLTPDDHFIDFFLKEVFKLRGVEGEIFPEYPTKAVVDAAAETLPSNTILFLEQESHRRVFT